MRPQDKNRILIPMIMHNYETARKKYGLTGTKLRILERLDKYNLTPITAKFTYKRGVFNNEQVYPILQMSKKIDGKYAKGLETEFKRFIAMGVLNRNVTPSVQVDMYWHLFILNTREYRKFCKIVLGRFKEHVPSSAESKTSKKRLNDLYNDYMNTMEMHECLFGKPSPDFWQV